ncbi:MAG: hypothetical protein KDA54_14555 [Phycisphaerales bacterium]|nr:hypothetical protein [Phycisphaerales bacterium]
MTRTNRRNVLASLAIVAILSASANAAELSLRFVGPAASDDTNAILVPGDSVTVEVLWTTTDVDDAANGLSVVSFGLTTDPEDPAAGLQGDLGFEPYLYMDNYSTAIPGWITGGSSGNVGGGTFAAGGGFSASVFDVGTTVLGSFNISLNFSASPSIYQFYIRRQPSALTPDLTTAIGSSYSFNPDGDGYNGQYNIGAGFAGYDDGTGAQPMTIVYPEPTTLAIVAFAAALVGCRRTR